METLRLKAMNMLKKECRCASNIVMYMKHIIVQPDGPGYARRKALKEEITRLVSDYFPEREEDLVFVLTGGELKDEDFRVMRKMAVKSVKQQYISV